MDQNFSTEAAGTSQVLPAAAFPHKKRLNRVIPGLQGPVEQGLESPQQIAGLAERGGAKPRLLASPACQRTVISIVSKWLFLPLRDAFSILNIHGPAFPPLHISLSLFLLFRQSRSRGRKESSCQMWSTPLAQSADICLKYVSREAVSLFVPRRDAVRILCLS